MATRTSRSHAPAKAQTTEARAPADWMGEWSRQQMAVASENACTVYRGFEALRRIQEQAARAAAERHAAVAQKLRKPESGVDLAFVQGELLREDVTAATRYWQDLASAVIEMNTELLTSASKLVDTEDLMAATSARFLHS
ncbi:phasin family protein [Ramlibacter montanisoli]|uniref:Phasin domain-containing protein n=1 Tax=Ramlibacter montanisoli TaxID=2732512 RepID=A0A849KBZ6_9BURK|nr:phasin family protein [Ramlibacter montanisoli]NNU43026.1 hypothetical protein [Ramlibacter montanisoli]